MKQFHLSVLLLVVFFSFTQLSCKKEPPVVPPDEKPPVYTQSIYLSVADSGLTEIYLKLSITDSLLPREFSLFRNNSQIMSGSLFGKETTLVDIAAQFNSAYSYRAFRMYNLLRKDSSNMVMTKTLDTTRHNWTWQVDTLGLSNSYLYDVAIINDTLAYAVGEIYVNDSNGQYDNNAYNLVQWNGKKWKLMRLMSKGSVTYPPLNAVWVISENIILFSWGGGVISFDGKNSEDDMRMNSLLAGAIKKIFAFSAQDIYIVGNNGTIVHFNGSNWYKIESGTSVTLNDVWGGSSRWIGNNVVLIAAGEKYISSETKIIKILNHKVESFPWQNQIRTRQSIWFDEEGSLYSCGSGVFRYVNGAWKQISEIPSIYTNRIRGNRSNDLIVVGDFGMVAHFNGNSWKIYDELKLPNGNYESVSIKGNLSIATGWYGQSGRAVIAMGKR